jgi:hypothetical protein
MCCGCCVVLCQLRDYEAVCKAQVPLHILLAYQARMLRLMLLLRCGSYSRGLGLHLLQLAAWKATDHRVWRLLEAQPSLLDEEPGEVSLSMLARTHHGSTDHASVDRLSQHYVLLRHYMDLEAAAGVGLVSRSSSAGHGTVAAASDSVAVLASHFQQQVDDVLSGCFSTYAPLPKGEGGYGPALAVTRLHINDVQSPRRYDATQLHGRLVSLLEFLVINYDLPDDDGGGAAAGAAGAGAAGPVAGAVASGAAAVAGAGSAGQDADGDLDLAPAAALDDAVAAAADAVGVPAPAWLADADELDSAWLAEPEAEPEEQPQQRQQPAQGNAQRRSARPGRGALLQLLLQEELEDEAVDAEASGEGQDWPAERVLAHRQRPDGSTEFMVRWRDYGPEHDSWERDVSEDLLEAYRVCSCFFLLFSVSVFV